MIDYDVKVGERIRLLREQKGLSQTQLAIRVGYEGRTAISKVEKGERKIQVELIPKFAEVLGTTPEYLMGWDVPSLSSTDKQILEGLNLLTEDDKQILLRFIRSMKEERKK